MSGHYDALGKTMAETTFDTILRRTSAVIGLAATVYLVMLMPGVREKFEPIQRNMQPRARYILRWMRNQTRMPWERELIGETEELKRLIMPQPKPEWYEHE